MSAARPFKEDRANAWRIPRLLNQKSGFVGISDEEEAADVEPGNYIYWPGDLRRYGDGSANWSTAVTNWLKVGAQGVELLLPAGTFLAPDFSVYTASAPICIRGAGRGLATIVGPGTSLESQALLLTTGSIYVDGVTFDNFYRVLGIGALTSEIDVEVQNCGFTDNVYCVYRPDAGLNTVGVGRVRIQGNVVDASGLAASRGFWIQGRYRDVHIHGNRIENVTSRPIVVGHNTYADQDQMVRAVISENIVRNIAGALADETQGILVYGRSAAITDNVLENISSTASSACEGIYTKCRFATITGNTLYDAGDDEASINIKGSKRSESSSPQGFDVICANNNIYFSTNTTAYGISIQQESVLVESNHIEGAGLYGIYTTNLALDNVTIRNNRIIKGTGERGISILHNGTGTYITGNEIIEQDTRNTIANTYGIIVDPQASPGLTDMDIVGNVIRIDDGSAATSSTRGIHISRTQSINGVRLNRNRISVTNTVTTRGISLSGTGASTNWEIQDNDISTDENPFAVTGGALPLGLDFRQSWRFQTTAAGPTSAMAFTLGDEASYMCEFRAVASLNDGAEQNMYHREGLFFRNGGGGATIVGAVQDLGTPQEVTAAWNATLGTSSNDVQVQLTGEAAHTINWRLWIHILGVSAT